MKLAIITGGSRGLGLSLTKHFAAQSDWQLLELSRSGEGKHHLYCDLTDPAMVSALCENQLHSLAEQKWEELVYISNAAMLHPISRVEHLTSDQINEHIMANQISAFTLLGGIMKAFRDAPIRKTLVNISSGAANKGYAGWSLYCASKAANENFISAIAAGETDQSAPFIAINYDPGVMDTRMQATIRDSDIAHFPDLARFQALKQDGELRSPDYVARDLIRTISLGPESGNRYAVS